MVRFYLDLDVASENVKIGWQKLYSLQATWLYMVQNGHTEEVKVTEVDAELKEDQTISRKEFLKLKHNWLTVQVFESVCLIVSILQTTNPAAT